MAAPRSARCFVLLLPLVAPLACGDAGLDSESASGSTGAGTGTGTGADTDTETTGDPAERCAPITVAVQDLPGERRLELVAARAMIPGLADQPTARGQVLGGLAAFDGRLHLGYGDYDTNTGPIAMHAWDPRSSAFTYLGTLPTEEVQWFRADGGRLYTPAIDPDAHLGIGGIYRLECGAAAWSIGTPIDGAVHVYDVAIQGDTIYAGTGSMTGEPARLMASTDYGESWSEVHRRESAADEFSRFYYVGATPELLFVSGSHGFASLRRGAGAFEDFASPPAGSLVPVVLGDAMVIAAFAGSPGRSAHLATYRIEGPSFVADAPWPLVAGEAGSLVTWAPDSDPARLLVMLAAADGRVSVQRTSDLSVGAMEWEELALVPPPAGDAFVSIALLSNDLYLGTRAGDLYALRELDLPAP